jgi:acylpyruvate hydrolase
MRWATIQDQNRLGVAAGDASSLHVRYQGEPGYPGDLLALLQAGTDLIKAGKALADAPILRLEEVTWLPLIPRPPKIVCVGLNYADHAKGIGLKRTVFPELFPRYATSLVGHNVPLVIPRDSPELDWESELVVVIGRRGRRISEADALAHVAGYSIFNEASLRDFQFRTSQFTFGKNFDGTGAFGPWLVTPDELPPGGKGLRITGRLNGKIVQDANTDLMLFDVPKIIACISSGMTLEPGDVIVTGTPSGVGFERKPPLFLKAGDVFEVEIDGVGVLRNSVIEETSDMGA